MPRAVNITGQENKTTQLWESPDPATTRCHGKAQAPSPIPNVSSISTQNIRPTATGRQKQRKEDGDSKAEHNSSKLSFQSHGSTLCVFSYC